MTDELLKEIDNLISLDVINEFNNIYIYDQVPEADSLNNCRLDYFHIIGKYRSNSGNNSNDFITVLQETGFLENIDLNNLNRYIKHIRIALINLQRFKLLKEHKQFEDYQQKIDFVLDNSKYFKLFREYNIPNYGIICSAPTNLDEINIFISKYEKSLYSDGILHHLVSSSPLSDTDKKSFILSVTNNNWKDLVTRYIDNLDDRMSKVDSIDRFFACFNILTILKENNIDVIDFLKKANKPILYFTILPLRETVEEVIDFNKFLSEFDYERDKEFILEEQFKLIAFKTGDEFKYLYKKDCQYIVVTNNDNQRIFYDNIKKDKIYKQDIELIQKIFDKTLKELQAMNYDNALLINEIIMYVLDGIENFITQGLQEKFKVNFLNYFSKQEIADIAPEVWSRFKELLPFNHIEQKKALEKIKTKLSAKQLALFIRLLIETEIIDNKAHKVQPLLKLISDYFSSIDTQDISQKSLDKNYYAKDYHADLFVLKANLLEMLKQIEKLQEK